MVNSRTSPAGTRSRVASKTGGTSVNNATPAKTKAALTPVNAKSRKSAKIVSPPPPINQSSTPESVKGAPVKVESKLVKHKEPVVVNEDNSSSEGDYSDDNRLVAVPSRKFELDPATHIKTREKAIEAQKESKRLLALHYKKRKAAVAKSKTKLENKKAMILNKSKGDNVHIHTERGVIYVGHIPFGFFEKEMLGYLSQFGEITRLRLARSRKSGRSKHYAFVEFRYASVAKIVADTLNNYVLYGRVIKSHVLGDDKIHSNMFGDLTQKMAEKKGAIVEFKKIPWRQMAKTAHNKAASVDGAEKRQNRLLAKEKGKRDKLAAIGIKLDFPGYEASLVAKDLPLVVVNNSPEKDVTSNNKGKKRVGDASVVNRQNKIQKKQ